jgi:hypothetical protein
VAIQLAGGVCRNSVEENRMKKIGFLTLLITATLLLTLALPVAASGPASGPTSAAVVAAVPASPAAAAPAPVPPPHPRVHEALEAMRAARDHMAHAEGEFHGHRAKAIEALDHAIHEAEECEREP